MEKQVYITEEERVKCQKVADVFAELYEMEDIVVLDVGRYGFVMLKYYKPPYGFEEDETFTDSKALFEALWEEWLHTRLYLMAKEMQLDDILYKEVFNSLSTEKQSELIGRKSDFAQKAGITPQNEFYEKKTLYVEDKKRLERLCVRIVCRAFHFWT